VHPLIGKIGPVSIYSYGIMIALAFLAGIAAAIYFARREGIKAESILDLSLYVMVAAVAGARLFYVVGQWELYRDNLPEIWMLQKGGLVFLGGLLFSILTVIIYARAKRLPMLKLFDALTPATALGYAIGRAGCFLNGCCFGLPTALPWGVVFPPGSLAALYSPGQHLHPTQIYSIISMLIVFALLILIYRRKRYDGQILIRGLLLYSVYRFLVEFLRFSTIHWFNLTPSQWLSLLIFTFGLWGWAFYRKKSAGRI
jgi:phosphatidylglycerol:prolipoprotein diacylglycerol transferase